MIFRKTIVPDHIADVPIARRYPWYTWSASARRVLARLKLHLDRTEPPHLVHLKRGRGYDYTFSLPHNSTPDRQLAKDFAMLASSLLALRQSDGIIFFTGLLNEPIDGRGLHYLFAGLRDSIAGQIGSPWAALYAPLSAVGDDVGEFLLHCDLYVPEILWNVFEDVASDCSGASCFVQSAVMLEEIEAIRSVPRHVIAEVKACLHEQTQKDRFSYFYDLLHGPKHRWTKELERRLAAKQEAVFFRKGEGYLLHDRRWLHGRMPTTSAINVKRVHRLVFVSAANGHLARANPS